MEKIFSHVSSLMAVVQSRRSMLADAVEVEVPIDDTGCVLCKFCNLGHSKKFGYS